MEVKIEVRQETVNGVVGEKKYNLIIDTDKRRYSASAMLFDLSIKQVKELIPLLTKELTNALKI